MIFGDLCASLSWRDRTGTLPQRSRLGAFPWSALYPLDGTASGACPLTFPSFFRSRCFRSIMLLSAGSIAASWMAPDGDGGKFASVLVHTMFDCMGQVHFIIRGINTIRDSRYGLEVCGVGPHRLSCVARSSTVKRRRNEARKHMLSFCLGCGFHDRALAVLSRPEMAGMIWGEWVSGAFQPQPPTPVSRSDPLSTPHAPARAPALPHAVQPPKRGAGAAIALLWAHIQPAWPVSCCGAVRTHRGRSCSAGRKRPIPAFVVALAALAHLSVEVHGCVRPGNAVRLQSMLALGVLQIWVMC